MALKPVKKLAAPRAENKPLAIPVANELARLTSAVEAATGVLDNELHELFAHGIASGKTHKESYIAAYPNGEVSASANAARLMRNPAIRDRVRQLQGLTATALVMDMQERREFLADVVRTPIGEVREDSPLCQAWDRQVKYSDHEEQDDKDAGIVISEKVKMPDKLTAIKLDAQLAGELDPDDGKGNIDAGKLVTDLISFVVSLVKPEKQVDAIEV